MSAEDKTLAQRVARLEAKLGTRTPKRKGSARQTLLAELDELEQELGMNYMMDEPGQDDEAAMMYMMDEPGQDLDVVEDIDAVEEVDEVDELAMGDEPAMDVEESGMAWMEEDDDMEPGCMQASEAAPGIEDQITQDSLSEVEDLRGKEGLASQPDAEAAARNTTPPEGSHPMWASEYVKRLKRASARLDAVADHVEKSGDKRLAHRIDQIADAIDARAEKVRGRK